MFDSKTKLFESDKKSLGKDKLSSFKKSDRFLKYKSKYSFIKKSLGKDKLSSFKNQINFSKYNLNIPLLKRKSLNINLNFIQLKITYIMKLLI